MKEGIDMVERSNTETHYRKLAHDWYDLFCTFDPTAYEHMVKPDAYYKVGHDEYHGHEGFATVAKIAKFLYPNGMEFEITDTIVEANKVAVRITTRAVTNKGESYENFYAVHLLFCGRRSRRRTLRVHRHGLRLGKILS
ncbi:nuclear transport factor 2 family protein [Streptomyces sp. GTA36]